MNARLRHALGSAVLFGAAVTLTRCALLVNLDVEQVPAGPPDGCAICTLLGDAGDDAATDGGDAAVASDGSPTDGADAAVAESGSPDAEADATPDADGGDGGGTDADTSG